MLVAGTVSPAVASVDTDADSVAESVISAAPKELHALPLDVSGEELASAPDAGGAIITPVDPVDGIVFESAQAEHATVVGLPGASQLGDAAVADDGSVTFAGDRSTPSVNVLVAEDAVRVSTVIASADQPERFAYDFGPDAVIELQDDGGALVLSAGDLTDSAEQLQAVLARIDAPWAVDAAGERVETRYEERDGTLVQIVEHRVAAVTYPVVADPSFDQPNIAQFRVRFNRAETKTIAQNGLASLGGAVCGVPMGLVCILAAGSIAWNAGVAENSKPKRCVQVTGTNTFSAASVVWWVDTYRGGPCK